MPSNVFNKDEGATAFKLEMSRRSADITRVRIKHHTSHTPHNTLPDSQSLTASEFGLIFQQFLKGEVRL